ncbi:hypothetical protein [Lewinella sp. IMCC34191]|uniref:hypothetical protein n=1 Tax=Lewinella sp. IMCC34191 TaxID=2259172 RepID=UPI000E2808A7|nr:hypothetical protein [Lewinella sp. IMCC34191]
MRAELAGKFELYPNQISQWKQEFIAGSEQVFEPGKGTPTSPPETGQVSEAEAKELYAKIGQLEMERDFLKKKLSQVGPAEVKRSLVDRAVPLPVRRQCGLLSVSRGSVYYAPLGAI